MHTALLILNLVASLASAAWAVVALLRPASLSRSIHIDRSGIFYVRMYAARAIPFGLAAGILPFFLQEHLSLGSSLLLQRFKSQMS